MFKLITYMKGFTLMSEYKGIGAGIQSPTQLKKIESALMEAVKILNTPEVKAYKKAQYP